jgi:diaminohydroxyphosphoribosylaminopyrimidine deaminase / 5-amino-6-(5-phosphoribosylamino)uracil reductase
MAIFSRESVANESDAIFMHRAIELAQKGEGRVEPNPMVGAVITRNNIVVGEGFHGAFGGPHAETIALGIAGESARGGTLYVTLEPCCHTGKTPPCVDAVIASGVSRVVVAVEDPFPAMMGRSLELLKKTGIDVTLGTCRKEADRLMAPYQKLIATKKPWVIAKWAMSLDGRIATTTGESRWISSEASRAQVHHLRGRIDGIVIGIGTAITDDPLLTARPKGVRTPVRIVLDSHARLPISSQLVRSAKEVPLIVVVENGAPHASVQSLEQLGCEIMHFSGNRSERIIGLLEECGRRRMTNLLVEGGAEVLGTLFDSCCVDETWAFIAPILIGGENSRSQSSGGSVGGNGRKLLLDAIGIEIESAKRSGGDLLIRGVVQRPNGPKHG